MTHIHALSTHEIVSDRRAVAAVGIAFFALATLLGAFVRIPVPGSPIPITLQTFFVLLAGAVLGVRWGGISQIVAIVLASACGAISLIGPTSGYLVGFIAAAYLVGRIAGDGTSSAVRTVAAFVAGSLVIYAFGVAWLMTAYRISPGASLLTGVAPFIAGDLIKAALGAMLYRRYASRSRALSSA